MEEIKTAPVYVSAAQKQRMFGIGEKAFYGITLLTVILMSMVSFYCLGIGIALLAIARILCKKEPLLMDFLVETLSQQDFYEG